MAETAYAILALLPVLAYFLYQQLHQYRYKKFAHIPSILKPNLFVGHVGYMAAGYQKYGNSKMHPGMKASVTASMILADHSQTISWRIFGMRMGGLK